MKFFLYSSTSAENIASSLGGVDYSYYFVLECYRPMLEAVGEVEILNEPLTEQNLGELVLTGNDYYFSFTPPNRVELSSGIPVIPVFAWEFGTLPDEAFVSPTDDWNYVLGQTGQAITHSSYAVEVVKNSLGNSYPVTSIPAPIWEQYADVRAVRKQGHLRLGDLSLDCTAIDSADFHVSAADRVRESILSGRPHDSRDLAADESNAWFGVHPPEGWGRWTKSDVCGLTLPYPVSGGVVVSFSIVNSMLEPGHKFQVELGEQSEPVTIEGGEQTVNLVFAGVSAVDRLVFTQVGVAPGGESETVVVNTAGVGDITGKLRNFVGRVIRRARAVANRLGSEPEVEMVDDRVLGLGFSKLFVRSPQGLLRQDDTAGAGNLLLSRGVFGLGFHESESWGRWTKDQRCIIFLPFYVEGDLTITVLVSSNPHQQRDGISLGIGGKTSTLALSGSHQTLTVSFKQIPKTNLISIEGLHSALVDQGDDLREVGLGISSIELGLDGCKEGQSSGSNDEARMPIVYTTVFNPIDGRKNWPDIINAFVFALRDEPRATLIVKLTHSELTPFVRDLCSYFTSLAPFECRIIFIHGYLEKEQFKRLILASHFVVNASRGEGQCLPLMEFMSSGVPAIAPDNTAMADYVTNECAFVVESTVEPAVWPHDPRLLLRTTRYRINWDSLFQGFSESFRVASHDEAQYARMSEAAVASLRQYCSIEHARNSLLEFLQAIKRG
jgi:hypothetical protein